MVLLDCLYDSDLFCSFRQLVVTIIFLIHAHDQDVVDFGPFDNRDVLSVAHTSLQEASIEEP